MKHLDAGKVDIEFFRLFFSLSLDLFCIGGMDGYFKHINEAWEHTLGYTRDELTSRPYLDFIHPDDREKTKALEGDFPEGKSIVAFENRFRCKDGSYRHLLWNCRMHMKDKLIFAVARDVTDQKKIEAALQASKIEAENKSEHLSLLLSQVPALAAILRGSDYRFEFANSEYCKLLGGRNPVGLKMKDVLPGSEFLVIPVFDEVYRTGEKWVGREFAVEADWAANGEKPLRYFTLVCSPLKDKDGAVNGIWVLGYEVTEFKLMRNRLELAEKMASLGTLAAGVAHEVNNPLAFVMGSLELISSSLQKSMESNAPLNPKDCIGKLRSCQEGLERIRQIVKSLKVFSRNEEEKPLPFAVEPVIESTLKFVENEVKFRAHLKLDIEKVPRVLGSEQKLGQVLMNLIVNSAHAIPVGQLENNRIEIKVRNLSTEQIEISVSDTGCGIPADSLNKIFDPFFTSKPVGQGTGLGLSICHSLVASMKGEIHVESQVGIGSTFKILLPVYQEEVEKVSAPAFERTLSTAAVSSTRKPKVLVVDDERAFGEVIALSLEEDFEVTHVPSVKEALSKVRGDNSFEAILCDLMMPEMTGIDFFIELERQHPGLESQMIFMTGGVCTREAQDFLGRIPNPTITKPFAMKDLRHLIHSRISSQNRVT